MNLPRATLHQRISPVFMAVMAAVLVLISGGANALALLPPIHVRCVPSHTINSSCIAIDYSTIQAAVSAAWSADVILVAPGKYNESVTITQNNLSLLGAQAGNDARIDRYDPEKESIVDASGKGNSAFIVTARGVIINGFTVQNGSQGNQAGIDLKGICASVPCAYGGGPVPASGAIVVNNIVQKNGIGIAMDSEGYGGLIGVLIEHNLIRDNNAPTGDGIFTSTVQQAVITENAFSNNKCAAIGINNSSNVTINGNSSEKDGSFVIFTATTNAIFSQNQGKDFGAEGVLPGAGDAAVAVGPGNLYLVISDNFLEEGKEPINNGIAFTNAFGSGTTNQDLYVKNNQICRFPGTGILAELYAGSGAVGTLNFSVVLGNQVEDNGQDGIHFTYPAGSGGISTVNGGNQLFDNVAEGNREYDCQDDTSGTGTATTGNTWAHDTGNLISPTGICAPGKGHDHH